LFIQGAEPAMGLQEKMDDKEEDLEGKQDSTTFLGTNPIP